MDDIFKFTKFSNRIFKYIPLWYEGKFQNDDILNNSGRVRHTFFSKLSHRFCSDYDFSPIRLQATVWTNAGFLVNGPLEINISDTWNGCLGDGGNRTDQHRKRIFHDVLFDYQFKSLTIHWLLFHGFCLWYTIVGLDNGMGRNNR